MSGDREQQFSDISDRVLDFFYWRRVPDPEELAQETMLRLWTATESSRPIHDFGAYALGIARNVLADHYRLKATEEAVPAVAVVPNSVSRESEANQKWMDGLTSENRRLLRRYFGAKGGKKIRLHKRMAQSLGISLGALRTKICRIRQHVLKEGACGD